MTGTAVRRTATTAAGHRGNRSFRAWDGTYEDLKRAAGDAGTPPTTLVGDAVEALLLRYIRCTRCSMPVPVEVRDCTGVDLAEAVAAAVLEVHAQRCWAREGVERVRRPAHYAVIIGNEAQATKRNGSARRTPRSVPGIPGAIAKGARTAT